MGRLCIFLILFFSLSCTKKEKGLRVMATAVPQGEILSFIQPELEKKGVHLIILVTTDYNMANRALSEGEIDANFFQHLPFLEKQIEQFHYPLTPLVAVEIEPMGIYSKKYPSINSLPNKSVIAIPNDPSNETRALLLLQKAGLLTLPNKSTLTPFDIISNPKDLQFLEVDAAMLPRVLSDVDAALINANYALQAKLNPKKDALFQESIHSPYANFVVIRKGEENDPSLKALKEAITSEAVYQFIETKYEGAVIPTFIPVGFR